MVKKENTVVEGSYNGPLAVDKHSNRDITKDVHENPDELLVRPIVINPTAPPETFLAEIAHRLGPDWKKTFSPRQLIRKGITMEKLNSVCARLRQLVPLSTALRAEGFTEEAETLLFSLRDRQPYKYCFTEFDKALAEGEANAIARLNHHDTTKREQDALKWMLERALKQDWYAQRTKTTKVITENRTVSVQMKLPQSNIKAVPALQEAIIDTVAIPEKPQ